MRASISAPDSPPSWAAWLVSRVSVVESSDGFEFLRLVDATANYLIYTRWRDEEPFHAWMEGPTKQSHQASDRACSNRPKPAASGSTV
ncbi:antibiotic biosynthesis monooxygenase family protein [Streptomyces geranii]|uniref:antibiotic biosynthesis monooxygenase family protein n=1 Tax=Streptomyces geranii TaxID=2058923 RepID=UPI001E293239|nr:antibiotic biosynthesis monooxygenase [Streptomyces geranii]